MNEQQVFVSLINALSSQQETAMTTSLIQSVRRENPSVYNRAVTQVNAQRKQRGQAPLRWELVAVAPAPVQQTVNTPQQAAPADDLESLDDAESLNDDMESLDDDSDNLDEASPNYEEFDESVAVSEPAAELINEDDESIEDDEEAEPVTEDDDFEDDEEAIGRLEDMEADEATHHIEGFERADAEPIPSIENLSFKHSLVLNIFLNDEEGSVYESGGKFFTTKQPLRRGKGMENDATGAVRASLENFIDGVKAEGEGIRFAVAVTDNIVDEYVRSLNNDVEARLAQTFDPESNTSVVVTSVVEDSANPWGGNNARIVHREIALRFSIPAIVSTARKQKDEVKMLASNLKIVNNLVRTLRESTDLENVQVNILIEDAVVSDLMNIFQALISEGNAPTFDRGYARFTVQTEDSMGGEVEG